MTTKRRRRIVVTHHGVRRPVDRVTLPPDFRRPAVAYLDKIDRRLYYVERDFIVYNGSRREVLPIKQRPPRLGMVEQFTVYLPNRSRNLLTTGSAILGYATKPQSYTRMVVRYDDDLDPYFEKVFTLKALSALYDRLPDGIFENYVAALQGWAIPT